MEPIYLETDEEITSVIDKLRAAGSSKLAIVVPKNSTLFQSLVNLKLLVKEAKELKKQVVLISGNQIGQRLAKQVGLETYTTLATAAPNEAGAAKSEPAAEVDTLPDGTKVHRYVPPGNQAGEESGTAAEPATPEPDVPAATAAAQPQPETTRPEAPEETPLKEKPPVELPAIVSRSAPARLDFKFQIPWKSLIAAAVILLIGLAIMVFFLPKATVTLTFPAKLIEETLTLQAKTVPDQEATTVAGNLLIAEKNSTQEVPATGKKDIGTKATGSIPVRNCEDTNSHSVAAGSKMTASGKIFLTNSAVTIPAGQFSGGGTVCNSPSVNIAVTAEFPGEAHNLSGATFTINGLSSRISGSGSTAGGTTKQVSVLAQEDVDKATASLKERLISEAKGELTDKAKGQTLVVGAIKETVKEQKTDQAVGAQVDKATLTIALELAAIVFDQTAVDQKVNQSLSKKLSENEQLVIPEDRPPALTFKSISEDQTTMVFEVQAQGFAAPQLDKKAVARSVNGLTAARAEAQLKEQYGAAAVATAITPTWWFNRLPVLPQAISVDYGFVETNGADEVSGP